VIVFEWDTDLGWTAEDAKQLNGFLSMPSGKKLLARLKDSVIRQSLTTSPITDRSDGIRQGLAQSLAWIQDHSRELKLIQEPSMYELKSEEWHEAE